MSPPEPTIFGPEARIPPNALPAHTGLLHGTTGRTADGNVFVVGYTWRAKPGLLEKLESWGKRLPHTQVFREGQYLEYGVRTEGFNAQTDEDHHEIVRHTLNWLKSQVFLTAAGDLPDPTSAGPLLPFKLVRDTTTALTPDELGFKPADLKFISCAELDSGDYAVEYLIPGVMVKDQPLLCGGPAKSLKTSKCLDACISLATATKFLGQFPVPQKRRVGIISGESGLGVLQETARRICRARNLKLSEVANLIWCEELPELDTADGLNKLARAIKKHRLEVLFLDPLYLCFGGSDHGNIFEQGKRLRTISKICQTAGVTLILVHHYTKSAGRSFKVPQLEDLSQSGFAEFARQWWLLGRRSAYVAHRSHELWLNVGGSAGHSGLYELDIDEGHPANPEGRIWQVEIKDHYSAQAEVKATQLSADQRATIELLEKHKQGLSRKAIQTATKISARRLPDVLATLVNGGDIVEGQIPNPTSTKGKTIAGYLIKKRAAA